MTAHVCLGDVCDDCRIVDRTPIVIELNVAGQADETVLAAVREAVDAVPGIEIVRPLRTEPWSRPGDHRVVAVVQITDGRSIPAQDHVDPEDGPSTTGAVLDAVMNRLDSCAAGTAGWLVAE